MGVGRSLMAALEEAATGSPLIAGNKVTLLYDGPQTMAEMTAAISAAKDHINLETYILVANTSTSPADVKVTLLFEDGTSAEQTYAGLAAHSRFNVPVGLFFPESAGRRFGALVESLGAAPAQIVVERAMYWDAAGQVWAAGTNALATKLQ